MIDRVSIRGYEMRVFLESLRALFSCNTLIEIYPFVLLPMNLKFSLFS